MSDSPVTLLDRGFSLVIAFLLPGLVLLAGIATVNPVVFAWFQGAQNGPTLVGLLFVLLGALALNIVITAVRWVLFERRLLGVGPIVPEAPELDESQRRDCE